MPKSPRPVLSVDPGQQKASSTGLALDPGHLEASSTGLALDPGHLEASSTGLVLDPGHLKAPSTSLALDPGHLKARSTSLALDPGHLQAPSTSLARKNPFPGPQPYHETDRDRFFGRDDLGFSLSSAILAHRCVTVYGPSGAGKSSLVQASVIPTLIEKHDIRLVRVDAWPEGQEPTSWLLRAMQSTRGLGSEISNQTAREAVLSLAKRASRGSPRLMVIYLDQMEQLLFAGRTEEETGPFWECLEDLIALPLRNVRVVLSLREDYLGRFRDRLRDMRQLTDHGFRIGPLTVGELTDAVVHAAAVGDPPQSWSVDEMRNLILQVRMVGQLPTDAAETQSVYAQIVCRALFQERAQGKVTDVMEAEVILRRYMEATLTELGALRERAQRLLEDDLVSADGTRTLRTEKELTWIVPQPELGTILRQLERSAILRAQEHHGSRYFEIGHDWLARWVYEQRLERTRVAAQKWLEEEQRQQLATARLNERRSRVLALGAITIAVFVSVAGVVGFLSRSKAIVAQQIAEQAMRGAKQATEIAVRERNKALEATRACQGNRGRQQYAPSALPATEIEGVIPPPIDPKTNDVNRASP